MALPIPRDAPVTTATLPRRPRSIVLSLAFLIDCDGREYSMVRMLGVKLTENRAMDLGIKGRRAIVTGGSSGIGYETARQFLEEGVRVLIAGRTADKLNKARDELAKKTGGEVHAVAGRHDQGSRHQAHGRRPRKEKLGGVDILVNNAGTMYSGRFAVLDDDELKKQLETKLFGFMRAIRLVYPMMKAQKWGRIVNTIGGAGKEPDPYMFGSGMTNAALLNLTKSLSTEFGEDNVLVNAICPGWVDTNLWRKQRRRAASRSWARSRRRKQRRWLAREELAQPLRQARGARQRHRVPVLGARELHHRRVAQSRRRPSFLKGLCNMPKQGRGFHRRPLTQNKLLWVFDRSAHHVVDGRVANSRPSLAPDIHRKPAVLQASGLLRMDCNKLDRSLAACSSCE